MEIKTFDTDIMRIYDASGFNADKTACGNTDGFAKFSSRNLSDSPANKSVARALVIFTGIGGTFEGEGGKYTAIAQNAAKMHTASTFIVPVHHWTEFDCIFDAAMAQIDAFYKNSGVYNYSLFVMGTSAGGSIAVAKSYKVAKIKKVLAVNPVIQIYFNRLTDGLNGAHVPTTLVFGENDPSAWYIPMVNKINTDFVCVKTLPGVDHGFTNRKDIFVSLPELYLFGGE